MERSKKKIGKRGQVSIFVIVAIVIVLGIVAFVAYQNGVFGGENQEFNEVYTYYDECIRQETVKAIDLAGSQGGRIDVGEYIPGSDFAPFSSHLNFLGFPIPYWYYVSGNGVIKENIPDKSEVEIELGEYLVERVRNCNLEPLFERGFDVELEVENVDVSIENEKLIVKVEGDLTVEKEGRNSRVTNREIEVNSKFGAMLEKAYELYEKETKESFLENYTLDVLNLNAPVDGVEIQCNPEIWKAQDVVNDLQNALEGNINSLRFGNKRNTKDDYFVVKDDGNFDVNAFYSKQWPWKIEIYGAEDGLMVAEPVGNQQGLGIIGFCYVPYHFVYDISYPVLFQIADGEERFQFPVAVIIDKNTARQAEFSEVFDNPEIDLCSYKSEEVSVRLFDTNLNPIDGKVNYECFNQRCNLGDTSNGVLNSNVPACVNGVLDVSSEGYSRVRQLFSTNSEKTRDVILSKLHNVKIELYADDVKVEDNAYITFSGARNVFSVIPGNEDVQISEGFYNLTVYLYDSSSLKLPESRKQECTQVPQSGIAGFFGATEERCFDVTIPPTNIDYALIGGGKGEVYVLESQLLDGNLRVDVDRLQKPATLEELQNNYASFAELNARVSG